MTSPESSYRLIPLSESQWAIVDESDYEYLMQWKWHGEWNTAGKLYAARTDRSGGKRRTVKMARVILGLDHGDKRQADHALHNTLDNRRFADGKVNLRIATPTQNQQNKGRGRNNTSGFKGVCWVTDHAKWKAHIRIDGKSVFLGYFSTRESAYAAYCAAAIKYHGEFACIK